MDVVLTLHAEFEMERRGVRRAWIVEVLADPWDDEPDPRGGGQRRAFRPMSQFGGRALRVAYMKEGDTRRVITVCWDRNRLRKWRRDGRVE